MLRAFLLLAVAFFVGVVGAVGAVGDLRQERQQQQPVDCDSPEYQKSSLTLLSSKKFAAMYLRTGHMRQFEASGISIGPSGMVAVVFDNSHALGTLDSPLAETGELLGERGGSQSGWEGVAWRDADGGRAATVLALREAVEVPRNPSSASPFSWAPPGFSSSGNSSSTGSSGAASGTSPKEKSKENDDKKRKKKKKNKEKKRTEEKDEATFFAVVDELSLPAIAGEAPRLLRSCPVDFALSHENKGLEDLYYLSEGRALALCEGNFCSGGSKGRERGNGRLLVLRLEEEGGGGGDGGNGGAVSVGGERAAAAAATARARTPTRGGGGGASPRPVVVVPNPSSSSSSSSSSPSPPLFAAPCAWRVDAVLDLPGDALFEDYSGLAVRGGLVAVLSQVDEAAFVAGFDAEKLEFAPVPEDKRYRRRVFSLPRSSSCERAFCTAEGIDLVDDPLVRGAVRVVVATDKAAAGSPWGCVGTSEAVHVMSLPKHALPQAPDGGTEGEEEKEEEEGEREREGGDEER